MTGVAEVEGKAEGKAEGKVEGKAEVKVEGKAEVLVEDWVEDWVEYHTPCCSNPRHPAHSTQLLHIHRRISTVGPSTCIPSPN